MRRGFQASRLSWWSRIKLFAAPPQPPAAPSYSPVVIRRRRRLFRAPQPPPLTKRVRVSQIKEDAIPAWVPADQRSLALVEVTVPRSTGGNETIVVTGSTARLIQMAGDAVYEGRQLRFPKWKCQVAVETRKDE